MNRNISRIQNTLSSFKNIVLTFYKCIPTYKTLLCTLAGDGQFLDNPLKKITGVGKNVATDFQTGGSSAIKNLKDSCDTIGKCVKENGERATNKTVTIAKETLNKVPVFSIVDVIQKSKCVIPKNADNILRASLLQQCISPSLGK